VTDYLVSLAMPDASLATNAIAPGCLAGALNGADAVIDVTHPDTIERVAATEFWTGAAGALQRTGAEQGVRHIVTLSIVGIEKTSFGYYAAKLEHERAAASGPVPSTVLRAIQFHELPAS
jgi:uncharacterized protein YbjT (DUF2867 family)